MFAIKIGTSYNKRAVPGFGLRLRQLNPFSCANLSIFLEDHTPSRLLHVPAVEAAFDAVRLLRKKRKKLKVLNSNKTMSET